jgi:hypothetical protein
LEVGAPEQHPMTTHPDDKQPLIDPGRELAAGAQQVK